MIMKSTLIKTCLFFFFLFSFINCISEKQPVKFAIASDFHAQDIPDGAERMNAFIQAASDSNVDFIIQLGDYVRMDSVGAALHEIWNKFEGEKYHVIGNHDMDSYTPEEYVKGMGMKGRYYSFDKGDFHFIVLDGNNLFDGETYTHYAMANYYIDAKLIDFVDPEQLEWLKEDLKSTDKKCVLFSHQSIDTEMNNGDAVRRILESENERVGFKKVVIAFSGHNHSNYTKQINGIAYMQINSASYVWIGQPTQTEKRYPKEINDKYNLLRNSIPYDKPLYAIVTMDENEVKVQGSDAEFVSPTPKDLNLPDSLGGLPLVSSISDVVIPID